MSSILILGGTAWLGREIATQALAAGYEVTCLARGEAGAAPKGARFVARDRRESGAYEGLDEHYDAVVEIAFDPALTEPALAALGRRAEHWTFVSTVSVYADSSQPGSDETAAVHEPTAETDSANLAHYGPAKVAAERAAEAAVGDRLLVVRPGLIAGPGDPSDRFNYWPARLARAARDGAGSVLAPGDGHVQVIDVADLAAFILHAGVHDVHGTVDAVGDPVAFGDFLRLTAAAAGYGGPFVRADAPALAEQGVAYWSGPRSLPLMLPPEASGFAQRSNARYRASGGTLRPLADTVARVLDAEVARGLDRPRSAGLTPAEEAEVLRTLSSHC